MMAVLRGLNLEVDKLYDRRVDPREIHNIADDPSNQSIIQEMELLLRAERAEIFELRQRYNDAA